MARHKQEHDPFIAIAGSGSDMESMEDCAIICDQRIVLKLPCGSNIANLAIVLMAYCHYHNVHYSPLVEDMMEFFQLKLLGLAEKKKHTVALASVLRTLDHRQDDCSSPDDDVQDCESMDSDATMLDDVLDTQTAIF